MYSLRCYKFINIASSTGINKAITHENDCLSCVFFYTPFAFDNGGSRTLAAFKMELFVTKFNGWKLLLSQRVPYYMWKGS